MSMTDPLGDMLTRIRNGQQARKGTVSARFAVTSERSGSAEARRFYSRLSEARSTCRDFTR